MYLPPWISVSFWLPDFPSPGLNCLSERACYAEFISLILATYFTHQMCRFCLTALICGRRFQGQVALLPVCFLLMFFPGHSCVRACVCVCMGVNTPPPPTPTPPHKLPAFPARTPQPLGFFCTKVDVSTSEY